MDYCRDKVDERNIPYELICKLGGVNNELPKSYILNDGFILNQDILEKYYYACVFFGESNNINEIYNKFGIRRIITNGKDLADEAISKGVLDIKQGAFLIDGPKIAKDMGLINGFAIVSALEEIKHSIVNFGPISVGSNSIDWKETLTNNNIAVAGSSYGHKFIIVGYDDEKELLICENSFGKNYNDNGRFYLKYSDLGLLFNTKTVNFINNDKFEMINFYIDKAKTLGYKDFTETYIIGKPDGIPKMLATLSAQIVFLKKLNKQELLELIK